eukprot:TCALIF_11790-PA protein Name:"Similar to Nckx30C Sodium/potassium/calcium exchanger Nckx30C (Drosophila melanogaster)" AED:0.29 eAED:0.34 QI:0/0.16/0.07/0.76/0.5/0.46/13/0/641
MGGKTRTQTSKVDGDEDKPLNKELPAGERKYFPITFIGSILWVAAYSYLMVWWATTAGNTLGIPSDVMGLTFLAAGTSVPDLITSVLVAQQGKGDMAVSSSVGSNIFDVTVGLPVPWLIYTLINGHAVEVSSSGVGCSVAMLFLMLILVFLSIVAFQWKMTKGMGMVMLVLYFIFVIVSLGFSNKSPRMRDQYQSSAWNRMKRASPIEKVILGLALICSLLVPSRGAQTVGRKLQQIGDPNQPQGANGNVSLPEEGSLFPPDLFSHSALSHGAVILHIIGILYMFFALALVCDEFFVPSLDVIIEKLGISPDVAGATFMAAGGSAPELFTSIIGVFIAKSDVGIGTIVGSAVFNILFVIAACAFAASTALGDDQTNLEDPQPEESNEDGPIDMSLPGSGDWKAIMFYVISFPIMAPLFITLPDTKNPSSESDHEHRKTMRTQILRAYVRGKHCMDCDLFIPNGLVGNSSRRRLGNSTRVSNPKLCMLLKPLFLAYTLYLQTFSSIELVPKICSIQQVMGLTFLAAGTSVPDLITSVLVAKQGKGDMAVSSSVGSNIFDVTVGLPLPWLIYSIVFGESVTVSSHGVACSILMLFSMLVLVFVSIVAFNWKMTKAMGGVMLVAYFVFVMISLGFTYDLYSCPF